MAFLSTLIFLSIGLLKVEQSWVLFKGLIHMMLVTLACIRCLRRMRTSKWVWVGASGVGGCLRMSAYELYVTHWAGITPQWTMLKQINLHCELWFRKVLVVSIPLGIRRQIEIYNFFRSSWYFEESFSCKRKFSCEQNDES